MTQARPDLAPPTAGQIIEIEVPRRLALDADLLGSAQRHDLMSDDAYAVGHLASEVLMRVVKRAAR